MIDEHPIPHEESPTFRDYVLKARSYFLEVLRYWYVPAFFALLLIAYNVYKYSIYVPVYTARVTFSVDEDEGGGQAGLSGMLSQFGLGNVRPARYNFDKMIELSRSRRVVQQPLFSKITIDGKEDYLGNHVIRIYGFDKKGYFTHDSIPAFSREDNDRLIWLYRFLIGSIDNPDKSILATTYNEESNILSLTATTRHETLSLTLAQLMFQSLSDYYINKAIEKSLKTFKIVSTKRDSILGELRSKEYQLANFKDRNRGLLMRTDQVGELRLQRDVAALSAMYAEVLKNTEVADFSLRSKTPFIQVIDAPIAPINPSELSLVRMIIKGLILGALIGSVLVIGRKAWREIMAE